LSLCSIIVVTHNNLALTKQCLDSLIAKTKYHPYEVIVVDSHSTDGTGEYLASRPEIKTLFLEKNFPYSYSLNRGIKAAKGEYLCFMNNDIIIVQPDWLKTLVTCINNDAEIGIVGPKLCDQNSWTTNRTVVRRSRFTKLITKTSPINWGEGTQLPRYIYPDGKEYKILVEDDTITPCTYVMGACFLAKRQLIDIVGLFDEGFFFAYDETDYCVRSWKAGRKVVCSTYAKVVHLVGKTIKAVTANDYEYDTGRFENPATRFYTKHSSKDFEMILKKAKGPTRFLLWKIQYGMTKALDLYRQGIRTIHDDGLMAFLKKAQYYLFK
jgi:GT2 family glycosyltransferase